MPKHSRPTDAQADARDLLEFATALGGEDPEEAERIVRLADHILKVTSRLPHQPGPPPTRLQAIERRLNRLENAYAALMAALAPETITTEHVDELVARNRPSA